MSEINVELRLLLDKFMRVDLPKAKAAIQATVGTAATGGGAPGTSGGPAGAVDKAATAQNKLAASTRKATDELTRQLRAWRELHRGGIAPGMTIRTGAGGTPGTGAWTPGAVVQMTGGGLASAAGAAALNTAIRAKGHRLMPDWYLQQGAERAAGMGPLFCGGGGGGGLSSQARRALGAFAGRFGLSGIGTAAGAGVVGVAAGAATAALLTLRSAAYRVADAMERARALYAKQLTSGGLPGGFVAYRSALAEVIGVGEDDVWQYGKAVSYLSKQLEWSSGRAAALTPELTATSWAFQVLKQDVRAAWMGIAHDLAPALQMVAKLGSVGARQLNLKNLIGLALGPAQGSILGGLISKIPGAAAPAPTVSAQRLQASAWERMGLVIGTGGGGTQYMRETAQATKRSASLLERIAGSLMVTGVMQGLKSSPNMP